MNAVDSSFDKASKGLADTLKTTDQMATCEQVQLLRAKSLLQRQTELIDRKIALAPACPKMHDERIETPRTLT